MSTFQDLFNSSSLEVVVPPASFVIPEKGTDDCLEQLKSSTERKSAFFDEKLQFLLLMSIDHPTTDDGNADLDRPPAQLLSFLTHIQVSYEATYISTHAFSSPIAPLSARLSAPPRTASKNRLQPRANPSIFPPNTPNPTPFTGDTDRKYIKSEGTLLSAGIWGEDSSENSPEKFSLLLSAEDQVWTAVFKLSLTVSFLRTDVSDPLLCLTVSATLRENPLVMTKARQSLGALIAATGGISTSDNVVSPTSANGPSGPVKDDDTIDLAGLEEVNLLEGLATGPSFPREGPERLYLPSTRLGSTVRRQAFSLPSMSPKSPTTTIPTTMAAHPHPTLRKSFRKTLQTVSGFRVRMRTVFVPYVLLQELGGADPDEDEDERERREAGTEERTVVLCVEVENSGESGMGFAVEAVDVNITGEGAKALLIGWGAPSEKVFPLLVGSMEQFNLLYAVSFWQALDAEDSLSLTDSGDNKRAADLQRAVSINIHGRPFEVTNDSDSDLDVSTLNYPTHAFASRWNCVLDLSPGRYRDSQDLGGVDLTSFTNRDALPEPASPFPQISTPRTATAPLLSAQEKSAVAQQRGQAVAGSKRHTFGGQQEKLKATPVNYRSSTSMLNPAFQRDSLFGSPKPSFTLPSVAMQQSFVNSPTTFSPRINSPPLPPPPASAGLSSTETNDPYRRDQYPAVPPTPAYPAYPSSPLPPTPYSQVPISSSNQTGSVGPSVEIRRERGSGMGFGGQLAPQTPGPRLTGATFGDRGGLGMLQNLQESGGVTEPIIVSVGLLPLEQRRKGDMFGRIYPLDKFTLDIFVFNQSSWIRRLEVSYPNRRRRKQDRTSRMGGDYFSSGVQSDRGKVDTTPGILPLENRIRIGPLRPSTCQSVRMEFLALAPGVHTVDTLTLTDVESGKSMNLRSVMDIVVHEPGGFQAT